MGEGEGMGVQGICSMSKVPLRESILRKLGFDKIGCEGIGCEGMKVNTKSEEIGQG